MVLAVLLLIGVALAWAYRDRLRSAKALYAEARQAAPGRAAVLYDLLARRVPVLEDYWRLWAAEARLPAPDAVETLYAVARYRPDGPSAFLAHLALARYYAVLESPQTVSEYRAALSIDDRPDIRLELARYLEEQNARASAYEHYKALLGRQRPDAFVEMRRTAPDELVVAGDLLARHYCSDVLDILREDIRCEGHRLRAEALVCLGRAQEAEAERQLYGACSAAPPPEPTPSPVSPQEEQPPVPTDAGDAQPSTAEDEEGWGGETVAVSSADPLELWKATWALEEEGRITEALAAYLAIASGDSYVADDAAYRAWVLARRQGDANTAARALAALQRMAPNWLAWRASGEMRIEFAPDYPSDAIAALTAEVLARVQALESLGREDLAIDELRLTALVSETPEVILRMAEELARRGRFVAAYSLGRAYIADHPYAPRAMWRLAYPLAYAESVNGSAGAYGIDPALVWAVMRQESAFAPNASSHAGARGLMQLMPATQRMLAQQLNLAYDPADAFTPERNIQMGIYYLGQLLQEYSGDVELALMAYNAGPGNVAQWLQDPMIRDRDDLLRFAWFGETREYVERVNLDRMIYLQLWAPGG
ncbi:MAG: lytic transglycosylase domain-containing protein [Chloroflexi bacterium]|nr:lytic transglycosylase domain-containing protein [Chloroflexota bacterium]